MPFLPVVLTETAQKNIRGYVNWLTQRRSGMCLPWRKSAGRRRNQNDGTYRTQRRVERAVGKCAARAAVEKASPYRPAQRCDRRIGRGALIDVLRSCVQTFDEGALLDHLVSVTLNNTKLRHRVREIERDCE